MKKVIHQLEITPTGETVLPVIDGSKILNISYPPHYGIVLSVLTDFYAERADYNNIPKVNRTFACFPPGEAIECADEGKVWEYIGTVFDANRNRGYHVHEKVDAPKPVEGTGDEKNPPALPPKPNHKK